MRQPGNSTRAPREAIARERLVADLRALGVRPGQTLIVHASLRKMGWVAAGAPTVVAALRQALGPEGTLVAGAGTPGNSLTSRIFREQTKGLRSRMVSGYLERMLAFDPKVTPTSAGAVAEVLRTTPAQYAAIIRSPRSPPSAVTHGN